jgi:hypothetical protein
LSNRRFPDSLLRRLAACSTAVADSCKRAAAVREAGTE